LWFTSAPGINPCPYQDGYSAQGSTCRGTGFRTVPVPTQAPCALFIRLTPSTIATADGRQGAGGQSRLSPWPEPCAPTKMIIPLKHHIVGHRVPDCTCTYPGPPCPLLPFHRSPSIPFVSFLPPKLSVPAILNNENVAIFTNRGQNCICLLTNTFKNLIVFSNYPARVLKKVLR
jgi:hypothetical protein